MDYKQTLSQAAFSGLGVLGFGIQDGFRVGSRIILDGFRRDLGLGSRIL